MKTSRALSIAALALGVACQPTPTEPGGDALRPVLSATEDPGPMGSGGAAAGPGSFGLGGITSGPGTFGSGGVTGTSTQDGNTTTIDSTQVTGRGPGALGSGG